VTRDTASTFKASSHVTIAWNILRLPTWQQNIGVNEQDALADRLSTCQQRAAKCSSRVKLPCVSDTKKREILVKLCWPVRRERGGLLHAAEGTPDARADF
jgi:hypothetical protein